MFTIDEKYLQSLGPSPWDDYDPDKTIGKDQYGRYSRLWRHKATGKIHTTTELDEATIDYLPQLNFARRQDKLACVVFVLLGRFKSAFATDLVGIPFFPLMVLYLAYAVMMMRVDMWRFGPYEPDEQDEGGDKE